MNKIKSIGKFFRGIKNELKRVTWSTKQELTRYTLTVILVVIFFTIFFSITDTAISSLIRLVLN